MLTRREILFASAAAPLAAKTPVIDTHIHLFEPDRFPYHPNAAYRPPAELLSPYLDYVAQAGIDHTIIVHPEPYQDDHRHLAFCFENERPRRLFKGTCLFDPLDPATPRRMEEISQRHPGRIVALRIHASNKLGEPARRDGAIRNRDLRDPAMKTAWRAAAKLGMAVQMHFQPHHAPEIGALAKEFRDVTVILDHMGRYAQGRPEDADAVLRLAEAPKAIFKFSGWSYADAQMSAYVKRAYSTFGADRIVMGGLGHKGAEFQQAVAMLDKAFAFAKPEERAAILGGNAARLFGFKVSG